MASSPVLGVSLWPNWPLRGVDLVIVNRRVNPPEEEGMTMSDNWPASSDPSIEFLIPLVRLSVRLSRSVFSPLTAPVLANPAAGLDDEPAEAGSSLELAALETLSTIDARLGEWPLPRLLFSVSFQSAGVGGTGPSAATPDGGGRRVGGDTMGPLPLLGLETL